MEDELVRFRQNWTKEISFKASNRLDTSSRTSTTAVANDSAAAARKSCQFIADHTLRKQREGEKDKCNEDKSSNSVISTSGHKRKIVDAAASVTLHCKASRDDYVNALISDFDEIYALPFFDLELPREICFQIFAYLDYQGLCRCSQVSKSWKSLADDEVLWRKVYMDLGYRDEDAACQLSLQMRESDQGDFWKSIVRKNITQEKRLRRHWRERICSVHEFEYSCGGVLCTVGLADNRLLAGYGLGEVKLYDLKELESARTFNPIHPAIEYDEDGIIDKRSPVTCLAIKGNLIAAGLKYGSVDVWHVEDGPNPIHHYKLDNPVSQVAVETERNLIVASSCVNSVRADVSNTNGQWEQTTSFSLRRPVTNLTISGTSNDLSVLVASSTDTLKSHRLGPADSVVELDTVFGAKITCLDAANDFLAYGVSQLGFEIPSEAHKLKLCSLYTGKLIDILKGHLRDITCVNASRHGLNSIITGCYDYKVRIYDLRTGKPVNTFCACRSKINTVQSDEWKAVSGSDNGKISVWDRRMSALLWETAFSFPLKFCHFNEDLLVFANIPEEECEAESPIDDIIWNRRHQGRLRLLDFSSDGYEAEDIGLPSICSSKYDEPVGYNYNIRLITPYDDV